MKKIAIIALALVSASAFAQSEHLRRGYTTSNGTYVAPSYATNPNNTKIDNYSTQGNYNPHTGKAGTVNPYQQPTYQAPQQRCGTNRNGQFVCN